ncbi:MULTISPECIES: GntR family transcriptional regulator [Bacillaceae]|uniref:GntR family transcriptional regulator n=1 Tax=Domibacillus aminovorans TaxID=29332 RepID=A0A177L9G6_9BACI|nr:MULTISPECIES: GntR family transcriptional regulator [Bacillaceae]OAH53816.1 GntR family transcriptional regulator [Domibacillus aminovorans]OAH62036.1 GntR family transcriptional regulator [Domibacillus aminovorans]
MSIKQDNRPLYLQVIDRLKKDIEKGIYKEKEKLPSEFELAKQLGVSRATLREALRILEEESVIIRRHGVGTFIHSKPLFMSGIEQLNSVTDMIVNAGMEPGTIFLSSNVQQATEEDARRFLCPVDGELMVIERVRTANSEPVVYCIDKIPIALFPGHFDAGRESLFTLFDEQETGPISHAVTNIEPFGWHEKISPILQCEPETAMLALKQLHYTESELPVLYSINFFRADKFSFHVLRRRM